MFQNAKDMISKIKFKNFKLFKDWQTLEIKPITILIGKNNTGKTAVLKLIPLLESSLSGRFDEAINLKDIGVPIAEFPNELIYGTPMHRGELMFEILDDSDRELKISLHIEDGKFKVKDWNYANLNFTENDESYLDESGKIWFPAFRGFTLNSLTDELGIRSTDVPRDQFTNKNLTSDYIGGFRQKAQGYYPFDDTKYEKSGFEGENLFSFLIDDSQTTVKKYYQLISDWIKEKIEGWELRVDYDGYRKDIPARISLEKGKLKVNLSQTGTGIAQVLPLIIRAYKPCDKETVIIIEEPESHLHPYAHAQLAQLFFDSILSDKNKRYLFETHSQNFVLRMRRLVAEGKLKPEDIALYYVDYDEDENVSKLEKIKVNEDGSVEKWPEGVFGETVLETRAIMNANINDLRNVD